MSTEKSVSERQLGVHERWGGLSDIRMSFKLASGVGNDFLNETNPRNLTRIGFVCKIEFENR